MMVLSWFISPLLSSLICFILFALVCSLTLGGNV
jgi:phosphate/sulfate permease